MRSMIRIPSLFLSAVFVLVGCGDAGREDELENGALFEEADPEAEEIAETEGELVYSCANVSTWNSSWVTFEQDVLNLVNQRRAAGATCGTTIKPPVPALTLDTRLRCSARSHSKDMGTKNYMSHTGSDGSTFVQRINQAGYTWTAIGENIAAGQTTPGAVVNGWMKSTGHCTNIMNSKYKHLGVGYYYAGTSTYKHYWTQNFGRP
jgi:uncharacterized protein YkwD